MREAAEVVSSHGHLPVAPGYVSFRTSTRRHPFLRANREAVAVVPLLQVHTRGEGPAWRGGSVSAIAPCMLVCSSVVRCLFWSADGFENYSTSYRS